MSENGDPSDLGRPFNPPTVATLATCDDEPIHIPGAVQPHGCLIEISGPSQLARTVSSNVRSLLGMGASALLGQPLSAALGSDVAEWVAEQLGHLPPTAQSARHATIPHGRIGTVVVHHYIGRQIVEWIADAEHRFPVPARMDQLLADTLSDAAKSDGIQKTLDRIAQGVKTVTGYDSVMLYRFHEDWHGEVVAEKTDPGLPSYKGLHYPASDIPSQARRLYVETRARVIADVFALDAILMSASDSGAAAPLDLSHAFTRSVSPIHIQYLRNMGSGATLVTSLVVGGKLWGLIACHHRSAYSVPWYAFERMRRFTDDVSKVIRQHLDRGRSERKTERDSALGDLTDEIAHSPLQTLSRLGSLLTADGYIACADGRLVASAQLGAEAHQVAGWVLGQPDDVGTTDALQVRFPHPVHNMDIAGIAWIVLSRPYQAVLILIRREFRTTVTWSGNPDKAIVRDPVTQRLSPRGSFDLWNQNISGRSRPWDVDTTELLESFKNEVDIPKWVSQIAAQGGATSVNATA